MPNNHSDLGFIPSLSDNHSDLGFVPKSNNEDVSKLESGIRGAASGASFGLAPAITGALEAAPEASGLLTGQNSMSDVLAAYNKAREASKANYDKAEKANPLTYMAGGFAGGLAPALLTGGASEAATGLSALESGALSGLKIGALSGAGSSISEGPKDLGDVAEGAIKGGAGGAILGGALGKLGGMLPGAESFEQTANKRALKATGIGKTQLKSMALNDAKTNAYKAGINSSEEPVNTAQDIGKLLLNKNSFQDEPVVTALSTPEEILSRSQDLGQKSGKAIGDILGKFDEQYTSSNPEVISKFFNPQEVSQEIKTQLLDPLMVNGSVPPVSEGTASTVQKILDTVAQYGEQPIPFSKAQELKGLITNIANYEQEGTASNQIFRRAGGIINKSIEDAADDVVKSSDNPELFDQFKNAKNLFKAAKTAEQASLGKSAANSVNRDFGITDYMSAAAGAAAKGPIGGIVAPIANNVFKRYGNPLGAVTANSMSNGLSKINKSLIELPKEKLAQFGQQLTQSSDPLSQKLGNVLSGVVDRDDIGRNALIFSLMQNESYRKLLRGFFNNDNLQNNK